MVLMCLLHLGDQRDQDQCNHMLILGGLGSVTMGQETSILLIEEEDMEGAEEKEGLQIRAAINK